MKALVVRKSIHVFPLEIQTFCLICSLTIHLSYLMQSNSKHRTAGSPVVRSACEPCHERKIRCIISTEGGPCDSCQSRRLSCFFLPRARSGRRSIVNIASATTTSSPSINHSSSDSRLSQPPTPNSEPPNDLFDWNWTFPAKEFYHHPQPIGPLGSERSLSNPPTTNGLSMDSSVANRDLLDPSIFDYQAIHLADTPALVKTDLPNLTKPTTPNPSSERENKTGIKLGEKEFSIFLQLCMQLQNHVALSVGITSDGATCESSTTKLGLQEMLGDVDRSCNAIFGVFGQGIISKPATPLIEDLDHASVSLVTALIFKVFQVCDIVLSCKELRNRGLMDLLLQKRLDFNLMQAKIVMSKIDELTQGGSAVPRTVASVASSIETKFKAVD